MYIFYFIFIVDNNLIYNCGSCLLLMDGTIPIVINYRHMKMKKK